MSDPVVARLDLYPANLTLDDTVFSNVRIIVTADRLYAFKDGYGGEGPVGFLDEKIEDFEGANKYGWTVTLADERIATFNRSTGCGCGSMLRSFRPFPEGLVIGAFK